MTDLAYQLMRQSNVGENKKVLQQLGVSFPAADNRVVLNKTAPRVKHRPKPKPKPKIEDIVAENGSSGPRLRSAFRIQLKQKPDSAEDYFKELDYDEEDEDYEEKRRPRPSVRKVPRIPMPNSYGSIPGVEVGRWWETRLECNADGIHRPTVAGIHGGPDGAYSIALSGGYEDDVDVGEFFTYTGEGGRDLKGTAAQPKNLRTGPQCKDQVLERGNLALARSVETKIPVRVIRGYKLDSEYAPESGYRYDGLYEVKKYWQATGKSGYKVYKYAFARCDPEPAPWKRLDSTTEPQSKGTSAVETESSVHVSNVSPTVESSSDNPDEKFPKLPPLSKKEEANISVTKDPVPASDHLKNPAQKSPKLTRSSKRNGEKIRKAEHIVSASSVSPTECPAQRSPNLTPRSEKKERFRKPNKRAIFDGDKKEGTVSPPETLKTKESVMFIETKSGIPSPVKCNTPEKIKQCTVSMVNIDSTGTPPKLKISQPKYLFGAPPGLEQGYLGWEEESVLNLMGSGFHLSVKNSDGPGTFVRSVGLKWIEESESELAGALPVLEHGYLGWEEDSTLNLMSSGFHLSVKNSDGPGIFVRSVGSKWIEESEREDL